MGHEPARQTPLFSVEEYTALRVAVLKSMVLTKQDYMAGFESYASTGVDIREKVEALLHRRERRELKPFGQEMNDASEAMLFSRELQFESATLEQFAKLVRARAATTPLSRGAFDVIVHVALHTADVAGADMTRVHRSLFPPEYETLADEILLDVVSLSPWRYLHRDARQGSADTNIVGGAADQLERWFIDLAASPPH